MSSSRGNECLCVCVFVCVCESRPAWPCWVCLTQTLVNKTLGCPSPSGLQGESSGLANVARWQLIGGTFKKSS